MWWSHPPRRRFGHNCLSRLWSRIRLIGGEICQKEGHPMVTAIDEMKRMMVPVRSVDAHVGILRLSRMENFNSMGVVDATLLTTAIVARIRSYPLTRTLTQSRCLACLWASTAQIAAMWTTSRTLSPRCSTCAGLESPSRIGPVISAPAILCSSL